MYELDSTLIRTEFRDPLKPAVVFGSGLVGGYQYYFGQSQRQGIKVSAHIYSGYAKWDFSTSRKNSSTIDPYTFSIDESVSYIPIQSGIDVKYLWDFLQVREHTLGLSVGVGYEFDYYIGYKDKSKYVETHPLHPERNNSEKNNSKIDSDFNFFTNNIYPVVGLHYYYGHHQFEVLYRFGGVFFTKGKKKIRGDLYVDDEKDGYVDSVFTIKSNNYFTFNYTYRF